VLRLFSSLVRINGRLILVGDGIKIPKRGRNMPAVKLLHQQSESNTKSEYIIGHSLQAVGLLVHAAQSVFSVPLAARIHEGLVWSNRDRRTLLDKMLSLLDILANKVPCYFDADAYYATGKIVSGLLKQGHHLVSRVKSNAVAYAPASPKKGRNKRGRPKIYGEKTKLKSLQIRDQCNSLPVRLTAKATSLFAIEFLICCGARRDGLSALWPSFISQEGLAY
jgi:DDE superfamily endonuclease